jgi:hypothetical protein
VADQRDVEVVPEFGRYPWGEQLVRLVRGRAGRDPPEPDGHPVDVGVHGERGPAHGERKHARGRLGPHPGQREQVRLHRRVVKIVKPVEIEAAFPLLDGREDLLDAARLLVGDAAAANGVGEEVRRCVSYLLPAREPVLELGERPFGVDVRGVLGQHGRDDLVDDRQHRLGDEGALVGAQAPLNRRDVLGERRCHQCLEYHIDVRAGLVCGG